MGVVKILAVFCIFVALFSIALYGVPHYTSWIPVLAIFATLLFGILIALEELAKKSSGKYGVGFYTATRGKAEKYCKPPKTGE